MGALALERFAHRWKAGQYVDESTCLPHPDCPLALPYAYLVVRLPYHRSPVREQPDLGTPSVFKPILPHFFYCFTCCWNAYFIGRLTGDKKDQSQRHFLGQEFRETCQPERVHLPPVGRARATLGNDGRRPGLVFLALCAARPIFVVAHVLTLTHLSVSR